MSDPEDAHEARRDPESADPVPVEPVRRSLWQWPVVRGVVNGAFFAVMLSVIQVFGLFREARPLDDQSVTGNIVAGVVFGFVMYIVELWRWHRRAKMQGATPSAAAADVARQTVEARLRRNDPEDGDPRP